MIIYKDILFLFMDSKYVYNYTNEELIIYKYSKYTFAYNIVFYNFQDFINKIHDQNEYLRWKPYNFEYIYLHFNGEFDERYLVNIISNLKCLLTKKFKYNNFKFIIHTYKNIKLSRNLFYLINDLNLRVYFTKIKFIFKNNLLNNIMTFDDQFYFLSKRYVVYNQ